jgi:hypothetical protein
LLRRKIKKLFTATTFCFYFDGYEFVFIKEENWLAKEAINVLTSRSLSIAAGENYWLSEGARKKVGGRNSSN